MAKSSRATVAYEEGGNNRLPKHFLRQVWESRCYWCRNYKGYSALEIDHILPKVANDAERDRLRIAFGLPYDYNVHSVYNLAPICSDCNKTKSCADLTQIPVVFDRLKEARRRAQKVVSKVLSFGNTGELGEALLRASEANLDDLCARETFVEGAPAIVQRLSELGDGMADYFALRTVEVEVGDEAYVIGLRLNESGRTAQTIMERVAGRDLEHALIAPLSDLLMRVKSATAAAFEDHDESMGSPTARADSVDWPEITIRSITFQEFPSPQFEFEFVGQLEAFVTGSVVRGGADGSGLDHAQGEASVITKFRFGLLWKMNSPASELDFDEVWLEDFQAETWVDGRRSVVWDDLG